MRYAVHLRMYKVTHSNIYWLKYGPRSHFQINCSCIHIQVYWHTNNSHDECYKYHDRSVMIMVGSDLITSVVCPQLSVLKHHNWSNCSVREYNKDYGFTSPRDLISTGIC